MKLGIPCRAHVELSCTTAMTSDGIIKCSTVEAVQKPFSSISMSSATQIG
jgi:hypothetical protein